MKRFLLSFIIFLYSAISFATHNMAGEIIYWKVNPNSPNPLYMIQIITYTDPSSPADRDSLTLEIRDCSTLDIIMPTPLTIARDSFKPFAQGIRVNYYALEIPILLPGPGCYKLSMLDPNRIDGINNITGSVNVAFYIEDTLLIGSPQFTGWNSSPVLLKPPIDFAPTGCIFKHNPAAYDPDGDSLHFQLIPPKMDPNTDVPGYLYPDDLAFQVITPNSLTINPLTGEMIWDVAQAIGIYNVAILIREFREGKFVGSMVRDMQIRVIEKVNQPPMFDPIQDTCVVAGKRLIIQVRATDPNSGQTLTISANGGPFFVTSPADFISTPSKSPVTGVFDWQTTCDHIRSNFYTVVFTVQDDFVGPGGAPMPFVDVMTWIVKVVAPPPEDLTATPGTKKIDLAWKNPYQCEGNSKFLGFSVWRKEGCDSLDLDTCSAGGGLGSLGYSRISGNSPILAYNYTDNTVKLGVVYSYRVVPEFADTTFAGFPFNEVSGLASNVACAELKKDVPILTHVDVITTNPSLGTIDIKWLRPFADDVDTILNPGPYKYELYRYDGFDKGAQAGTLIFSASSPTFVGLNANQFTDSGLNTQDQPYNYTIQFFATDQGNFYEVGESENGSSIYLSIGTSGNQLDLSWEENVPWVNYKYIILKETFPGSTVFLVLDSTDKDNYTDFDVSLGEEYCYKIRAFGSYFNPTLPEPFINHSQIQCGVPIDTIAPCSPALTVSNGCDDPLTLDPTDLKNLLEWNNPNNSCANDVAYYNIYYKPNINSSYSLIETTGTAEDTTYLHEDLTSLAGCYVVTAVDSFENESVFSNEVCLDNCPRYILPNVFTPNGDGSNDQFVPFKPYFFIDHIEMKVFNRWGDLIFETSDPDINWSGESLSGKAVPEGVYFYVCEVFETRVTGVSKLSKPLSGYIHLIRGGN